MKKFRDFWSRADFNYSNIIQEFGDSNNWNNWNRADLNYSNYFNCFKYFNYWNGGVSSFCVFELRMSIISIMSNIWWLKSLKCLKSGLPLVRLGIERISSNRADLQLFRQLGDPNNWKKLKSCWFKLIQLAQMFQLLKWWGFLPCMYLN